MGGQLFLITLNVPLVRYWLSVFKIPYAVLFPSILFFCCIGTYSVNNNLDDIFITAAFGLLGYLMLRLELDAAPLMLGFILGPCWKRTSGAPCSSAAAASSVFVTRPISGSLFALIGLIVWQVVTFARKLMKSPDHIIHGTPNTPAVAAIADVA